MARAVIFDIDGVLVDSPHETAWREALRELMDGAWRDVRDRTTWSPTGFTSLVYRQEISGRPRLSGARAALEHFGVPDEDGRRAAQYAERKQALVRRLIEAGDFTAYPDGLRFVRAVRAAGLRTAAASSSKNATLLLRAIPLPPAGTLLDAFDADVSGRDVAHGKPHPELFLLAAGELGIDPGAVVVVEDAPAGVAAAKAGGMGAIGVARAGDASLLHEAGADLVAASLDDVDVAALAAGRLALRSR